MKPLNVVVTGGGGMLARAVEAVFAERGHTVTALEHGALDVTDSSAVHAAIKRLEPAVVVQCAAYTRVDDAESNEPLAMKINATACANVAEACRVVGARLVYPSTDYVFDGTARRPYRVDAVPNPINAYGRSKLAGERAALSATDYLIVRTGWLYGAGGRNFVRTMIERMTRGQPLRVVDDQQGAPTTCATVAEAMAELIEKQAPAGIYHATNSGMTTWYEAAKEIAAQLGGNAHIEPCRTADYPTPAVRPAFSVLDCSTTVPLAGPFTNWREALAEAIAAEAY